MSSWIPAGYSDPEVFKAINSQVIMLPVFPVMALSGPLFTKLHDGEADRGPAQAKAIIHMTWAVQKTLANPSCISSATLGLHGWSHRFWGSL